MSVRTIITIALLIVILVTGYGYGDLRFSISVHTYGTAPANNLKGGYKQLILDLYTPRIKPDNPDPLPIVIIIHGGGFKGGSRRQRILVDYAESYARVGYLVASIDYRVIPDGPVLSDSGNALKSELLKLNGITKSSSSLVGAIAAIEDSVTAIQWLKSQTDIYNIDWSRFGLLGGSAGSITAINIAYLIDDFEKILIDPHFQNLPPIRVVINHWGGLMATPKDSTYIEADEAVLFTVHGTADKTVPFRLANQLKARTDQIGLTHEFHPIEGAAHGFSSIPVQKITVSEDSDVTLFERAIEFMQEQFSKF